MKNEFENILEETESKFGELNKKLEDLITEEQSKINYFKKKIKNSIIWLLIIASLGCISVEAYKFKRKQDVLFENSRYYQAMENETLETIAKKVCKDSYSLDKIIEFNKKFDKTFDSIAEKGEIIHFPKKYVKNIVNGNIEISPPKNTHRSLGVSPFDILKSILPIFLTRLNIILPQKAIVKTYIIPL